MVPLARKTIWVQRSCDIVVGKGFIRCRTCGRPIAVESHRVCNRRPLCVKVDVRRPHRVWPRHHIGQPDVIIPFREQVSCLGRVGRLRNLRVVVLRDARHRRPAVLKEADGVRIDLPFCVYCMITRRGNNRYRCNLLARPVVAVIPAQEGIARPCRRRQSAVCRTEGHRLARRRNRTAFRVVRQIVGVHGPLCRIGGVGGRDRRRHVRVPSRKGIALAGDGGRGQRRPVFQVVGGGTVAAGGIKDDGVDVFCPHRVIGGICARRSRRNGRIPSREGITCPGDDGRCQGHPFGQRVDRTARAAGGVKGDGKRGGTPLRDIRGIRGRHRARHLGQPADEIIAFSCYCRRDKFGAVRHGLRVSPRASVGVESDGIALQYPVCRISRVCGGDCRRHAGRPPGECIACPSHNRSRQRRAVGHIGTGAALAAVGVEGNQVIVRRPDGIKRKRGVVDRRQINDVLPVLIHGGPSGHGRPAQESVSCPGITVERQVLGNIIYMG
ncbi:MAG: hypothetical protein BWY37_02014 [Firmicutes bacterium ADurb.Bin262]|nr:MAG: hypothetical protein BWY37_02014 [Firmicutes bacterium ADurb.Bin262]